MCYSTIETRRHLSEGDRRRGHVQDEAVAVFAWRRHADGVGAQRALKRAGSRRWSVGEISSGRSTRMQAGKIYLFTTGGNHQGGGVGEGHALRGVRLWHM